MVGGLLPGVFVEIVILIYLFIHIHIELTSFAIYKAIYLSYLEILIPKQYESWSKLPGDFFLFT